MSANDHAVAARLRIVMQGIEEEQVGYDAGIRQLLALVQELHGVPASWKDKLLELCNELELVAGDEYRVAGIMERIDTAVDRILGRPAA